MTAGHKVTPSDEVDQAWHLHLTYTQSYWEELCGGVLGRPLHHGPTKGGAAEGERFEDQYEQTLASYRKAFDEEPPTDIWPPAAVRFGEAANFVRVNRSRNFVLPWPQRVRKPMLVGGLVAVGLFGLAPLGETSITANVIVIFLLLVLLALIARAVKRRGGGGSGCGGWFGCGGDSGCGGGGCGGGCGGCGG